MLPNISLGAPTTPISGPVSDDEEFDELDGEMPLGPGSPRESDSASYERDMAHELFKACEEGNAGLIEDLINEGHGDLTSTNELGESPLSVACRRGHAAAARALCSGGIDILQPDHQGSNALHLAAAYSSESLEALLEHITRLALQDASETPTSTPTPTPCSSDQAAPGRAAATACRRRTSSADGSTGDARWLRTPTGGYMVEALAQRDEGGNTPLHLASREGNCASMQLLLNAGADPLALDAYYRTPFFLAAAYGQVAALQLLLDHPSCGVKPIMMPDSQGYLPIFMAAMRGQAEVLPLCVADGLVSPNEECPLNGRTPLHIAGAEGHTEVARVLLQQLGADANVADAMGTKPLALAAEKGCVEVLQLLLQHGAAPNIADREGWLPLHLASNHGHAACVDALLAADGGPIDACNEAPGPRCGFTALHCAAKQGNLSMCLHLLSRGADPTVRDGPARRAWTPLHHAAADGQVEILAVLAGEPVPSPTSLTSASQGSRRSSVDARSPSTAPPHSAHQQQQQRRWSPLHDSPMVSLTEAGIGLLSVDLSSFRSTLGAALGDGRMVRDPQLDPAAAAMAAGDAQSAVSPEVLLKARAVATQLVGHSPLSLAIVREHQACIDLLVRVAHEDAAAADAAVGDDDELAGIDWAQVSLQQFLHRQPGSTPHAGADCAAVVATATNGKPSQEAGKDEPRTPVAAVAKQQLAQQARPDGLSPVTGPGAWPATPGRGKLGSGRLPEEWEALGLVSGLVDVGADGVLRTTQGNSDVEAWLMRVAADGSETDAGWRYFEVEVLEPGESGLFWTGFSTGLDVGGMPHPRASSSSPALTGVASGVMSLHSPLPGAAMSAARSTSSTLHHGRSHSGNHGSAVATAGGGAGPSVSSGSSASLARHGSAAGGDAAAAAGASGSHAHNSGSHAHNSGSHAHNSGSQHPHLGTSYVICSIDGHRVHLHGGAWHSTPFSQRIGRGDVVGVMYNRACNTISLTLNRKYLGIAFSDIAEGSSIPSEAYSSSFLSVGSAHSGSHGLFVHTAPLHPIIGIKSGGASLRFVQAPFHKNIDGLIEREEQLHNPHHNDPAQSLPWRFKSHLHAMHFAASCGNQLALTTLLEKWPQHVDARDDDGWTPLTMACMYGNVEAVRTLLAAGADVNAVTSWGSSPIIFAVRFGHLEVLQLLVAHNANLRARDHNGRTLLMRAARCGNIPAIDLLLQKGVDLHATDNHGKSVLQFAKNDEVFRFLFNVESADRLQPDLYQSPQSGLHRQAWDILPSDLDMEQWPLGTGSFGAVFKAKLQGSDVAVKQLQKLNPQSLAQFQEEINLMVQLRHPNIIQFLGAVTVTNSTRGPAIVTELAPRGNLSEVLQARAAQVTDSRLIKMAADVARGILYLHELKPRPIVHRDLKPANCLVTYDWTVKIGDFGLSSVKHKDQFMSTFQATPIYMAPELVDGNYNEKVDVYSYGAVLYEMVTGTPPWTGLTAHGVLGILYGPKPRRHLRDELPATGLSPSVRHLIWACLDPQPQLRPSFREILQTINAWPRSTRFRVEQGGAV